MRLFLTQQRYSAKIIFAVSFVMLGCITMIHAQELAKVNIAIASDWKQANWVKAKGQLSSSSEVAPSSGVKESIKLQITYNGKGFQYYTIEPKAKAPGSCRKLTFWAKSSNPAYSWAIKFKDGKGKEKLSGKNYECHIRCKSAQWKKISFTVPEAWPQPVAISAITGHNWNKKGTKGSPILYLCNLETENDVSKIKDKNSLLKIVASTGRPRNIFENGEKVNYQLSVMNWLGIKLKGTLNVNITNGYGKTVLKKSQKIEFASRYVKDIKFQSPKYGIYKFNVNLDLNNGRKFNQSSSFAYIPIPRKLTKSEKMESPYGMNIHGAMVGVAYKSLAKLGISWIRDYAYTYEWILRAKKQGDYSGWPWYPKIDKKVKDSGLMLLACFSRAISDEVVKAKRLTPTKQWKSELMKFMMAFPDYPAWEIDNEYDLRHSRSERDRNWSSYKVYHKKFAQAVKAVNEDSLAVEQGNAGIYPKRLMEIIKSGSFNNIDVVNSHFYTGIEPPEISRRNMNAHGQFSAAGLIPVLLTDLLREYAIAADIDGRNRQAWITEFGWDTLAGKIVSEREQAAYLQRGYMLGLNSGMDKMFWYWNRDTKKPVPDTFFDGCGIFNPKEEPKPAAATLAAMTYMATLPKPVGTCQFGSNTMGYVMRDKKNNNRLFALAFKIQKELPGQTVKFKEGKLYDMYANPLKSRTQKLDITPVWNVGITENNPMYLQTAFDLKSRSFDAVTAGDNVRILFRIKNNRKQELNADYSLKIPKEWKMDKTSGTVSVAPGKTKILPLEISVPENAGTSSKKVFLKITDSGSVKILTSEYQVEAFALLIVNSLSGDPGKTTLTVSVKNNSNKTRSFSLKPNIPAGWKISPPEITVDNLAGKATRIVKFDLDWNLNWKTNESARIELFTKAGVKVTDANIFPSTISIPKVTDIKFDGKFSDWPKSAQIPSWILGITRADIPARVYLGYSNAGLYFACEINESKVICTTPKRFWDQDTIEIFVDSKNNKTPRDKYASTDHQFWLCPLAKEQKVYLGRWKRNNEISGNRFDIKTKGFCKRTKTGYILEGLIPASEISGFNPEAGSKLGLNFNITVQNPKANFEIFWKNSKTENVTGKPASWGTVILK